MNRSPSRDAESPTNGGEPVAERRGQRERNEVQRRLDKLLKDFDQVQIPHQTSPTVRFNTTAVDLEGPAASRSQSLSLDLIRPRKSSTLPLTPNANGHAFPTNNKRESKHGGLPVQSRDDDRTNYSPNDTISWGNKNHQTEGSIFLNADKPTATRCCSENRTTTSARLSGFLPMLAVSHPDRSHQHMMDIPPAVISRAARAALFSGGSPAPRFSVRYHGMHTETNASAEYLDEDQNCALWVTNLPPDVTHCELLGAIRNVGRIWCTFINSPDYVVHRTAAAKVVFFLPEAAQRLLSISWTIGLTIRGHRLRVAHNRIKYAAHDVLGRASRVLIVTGSEELVNEEVLTRFFRERFIFQIDSVISLVSAAGRAVVEFRFGSYRCQAQMGKMALEKDRPRGFEKVEFGDDPCEVGDTLSSYGIAGERIQGKGL